jgi:hypothetical protein
VGLGLHIRDLLGWQWFAMGAVALAADGLQWEVATLAGGCTDDEPRGRPLVPMVAGHLCLRGGDRHGGGGGEGLVVPLEKGEKENRLFGSRN